MVVKENQMRPLTLKKARALALQEFGTAKGLEKDSGYSAGYYCMSFGNLCISIHNNTSYSEHIKINLCMGGACVSSVQLYNPDTLEEDFKAEERYRRELKQDVLREWVGKSDLDSCHAEVNRIWDSLVSE